MAEEIRLVGSFQDNITPKLKKLNREIAAVTRSFTKMQKKLKPIARDMGKMAAASERTAQALQAQRKGIDSATRAYSAYTRAVGKAVGANRRFKPTTPSTPTAPTAPSPGAPVGGGNKGFLVGGLAAGGAAFGAAAGAQMSTLVNSGLRMGFDYGKDIIMGAFQKFGAMIGERIEDEMSDIQSAGGMFALDKKQDPGARLFANFTQARNMQELLNRELAKSAAALPGATSDYVQSAKQLTDTVFGTFAKDKEAFADLAVGLGGKEGGTDTENITKVLSRFTEQSVLLSQGAGKGGMPLGMLLEQLITMENVNVDAMKRRYAQLRKNPLLANMLKDAEEAINASGAGTADRFKAVMEALDNALPEEVINSMRRSVSGVTESIRSAFLDPEVGLLGLGRPLKSTVASINSFGQYIDGNGKVVMTAAEAARENTTVFKLIRDILAGFGGAIGEIASILPQVFDPLVPLADALMEMRDQAVEFAQTFTGMANFIKAKGLEDSGARAGIAAFSNMLRNIGAIDDDMHKMNVDAVMSKDADFASVVPRILDQLLKSDFAEQLGRTIGEVMGTIIATIGNVMAGVADSVTESGLAKGFMDGWNDAGGTDGIKQVFGTIFSTMMDLLLLALKEAPMESLTIGLIALAPAFVAGFTAALPSLLAYFGPAIGTWVTGWLLPTIAGWLGAVGPAIMGIGTFITGTALPALAAAFTGIATFVTGTVVPALSAAASAFIAVAAPVLAVVGAVTGLVAIFRHADFIVDSFVQGLVFLKAKFYEFSGHMTTIAGRLMSFIGNIPGFGGLKETGQQLQDTGAQMIATAQAEQAAAMERIAANTEASLARTQQDFTEIGNMIGLASDQQVAEAQKASQAAYDNLQAVKDSSTATTTAQGQTTTAVNNLGGELRQTTAAIQASANRPVNVTVSSPTNPASASYNGNTSRTMPLGQAIATENANKPAGSHLVIANSSETVIPAYKGYTPSPAVPAYKGYMAEPAFTGMAASSPTSATSTSSEIRVGDITVNVSGVEDPRAIADQVAEEILRAITKNSYTEIYTT